MEPAHEPNEEQSALWNGPAGHAWVEVQAALDAMFLPFERLLAQAVPAGGASHVLDVGCGTGSTTLAFAQRVGAGGRCVGVDISAPMVELARQRAERAGLPAQFILADAQVHSFDPARFDLILSRFGVMFFEDPVQAFGNLRQAAKAGGALRFIAWRSPAENPFMTLAECKARPLLPAMPKRPQGGPGQFAFADRDRVAGLLGDSGWGDVEIAPIDIECAVSEQDLARYLRWMGPVGQALQQADEATREHVVQVLRAAFAPFVSEGVARYNAACWQVTARSPA